jgi:hypothetical protein
MVREEEAIEEDDALHLSVGGTWAPGIRTGKGTLRVHQLQARTFHG